MKALTASTATVTVKAGPGDGWMSDEGRQGTVSLRTYSAYIGAAGGVIAVVAVLVASVMAEGVRAFSFWWLAYWLAQGSGSANVSDSWSFCDYIAICVSLLPVASWCGPSVVSVKSERNDLKTF